MSSTPPSFGGLLRKYRLTAGWTQAELAKRAKMSVEAINTLERGTRRAPRPSTMRLLAKALALSTTERAVLFAAAQPVAGAIHSKTDQSATLQQSMAAWPLVGRKRELEQLERHLAGEGPPVLWLTGEPGIGKSRLLAEASQLATGKGWCVVEGGCHRRGGQEPYAPLLGALESRLQQQSIAERRLALEGCTWLVKLLPELAESRLVPVPRWNLPPEQEQRLMFAAVHRFLTNIAGPAGTLLVLDDLQWAGADALDLLVTLVRSSSDTSLRVIGAYRSTEAPPQHQLAGVLDELTHDGLAALIHPGPLAPAEAAELAASLLQGVTEQATVLRESLLPRTGGVPYFLVSCAQALRTGMASDALPSEVAQSIRQRVAALPTRAQELLGLAAVAGRRVERAILLSALSQLAWEEADWLAALEAACQARLLEEEVEAYHFPHDLVREVVAADLSAARRAKLHGRVAQALEQQPGELPNERLAFHYTQAGAYEQSIVYLERAGEHAQKLRANAEAAGYFQELIDQLERLGRPLEAAEKRRALAPLLLKLERHEQGLQVLEQALEAYRAAGRRDEQLEVLAEMGWHYQQRGTPQEGVARLQSFLESMPKDAASPSLVAVYSTLAILHSRLSQTEEERKAAERAVTLARIVGEKQQLVGALHQWAVLHHIAGKGEAALQIYAEEIVLAQEVDDRYTLQRAYGNMSELYADQGQFAESLKYSEQRIALVEQLSYPALLTFALSIHSDITFVSGDWKKARHVCERALALCDEAGVAAWQARIVLLRLSRFCLAEGHYEQGQAYLTAALAEAERFIFRTDLWEGQALQAEYHLHQGLFQEARACLEPLRDQWKHADIDWLFFPLMAWACLELGEEAEAEALLEPSLARTRARKKYFVLADGLLIQARLLLRQRRWLEASRTLDEVLTLVQSMPAPYIEAKALYLYGLLHKEQGEAAKARERLEAALVILYGLGERLYAGLAEQVLAGLAAGEWTMLQQGCHEETQDR